jgi:hypothetical protein
MAISVGCGDPRKPFGLETFASGTPSTGVIGGRGFLEVQARLESVIEVLGLEAGDESKLVSLGASLPMASATLSRAHPSRFSRR